MDMVMVAWQLVIWLTTAAAQTGPGELGEYCVTDQFEAKCPGEDIVVIQEARFGRMRIGKCVKTDFGYLGCEKDVLDILDRQCSGRHACAMTVPIPELEERIPCNPEFKSYLEARWTCVQVISTNGHMCQGLDMTVRENQGYLSNAVTETTGCGTDSTPWKIEASSGQKINFTVYDFAWSNTDNAYRGGDNLCPLYAVIKETGMTQGFNVCGRRGREYHVYTSVTNSVEVRVSRQYNQQVTSYFLIKFEVVGCIDPVLPASAWLRRSGDVATIGCNEGDKSWEVYCHGNQWSGTIGNCSNGAANALSSRYHRLLSLPMDVAIVIIAGVAFVIGAIIFVIGLYIIRRRHFTAPRHPPCAMIYQDEDPNKQVARHPADDSWKIAYQLQNKAPQPGGMYMQTSDAGSANENEYAYVWDTAPSPPGGSTFVQSLDGAVEKRVNFREPQRSPSGGNTNAHDGQYEKRLPTTQSGLDSVYERGTGQPIPHPQYFELDQMSAQKAGKD